MLKNSHRLRLTIHEDCSGFTLLEVLISLAVLGIAVTLIFQVFSASTRNIALSEDYVAAVVAAENRMQEMLDDDVLTTRNWSEVTEDGYRIDAVVSETLENRTQELPVKLVDIAITIYWMKNAKQKSLTLRTMKVVERKI